MKRFYTLLLLVFVAFGATAQQTEIIQNSNGPPSTSGLSTDEARKQRGFVSKDCFVPKGQWIFGGTASYSAHRNQNYKFTLINDIDSEGYTVNISPMIAYAPWRNMAVGVRFGYGRSLVALDNASLSVSDVDINVDMFHQIKHSYTGTLFWRPYIPLGTTNRFALFAEVQLSFSGGQSRVVAATSKIDNYQDYRGTYTNSFGASIGLQPGIVAFITNNAAVELSIGVLGIGFDRQLQTKNQVEQGKTNSLDTNFKLNLLSVGFGMSFYL
jgi:hypothetical protein